MAKQATLHSIQVADCDGDSSDGDVVDGIEFVIQAVTQYGHSPGVINISMGRDVSWWPFNPMEDAVRSAVNAGITVTVAAGNEGQNACDVTPARVAEAITVGATMSNDSRSIHAGWWTSNYGTCVDIFAPGSAVDGADPDGYIYDHWGTSVAAPQVAGAAALMIDGSGHPYPTIVRNVVRGSATTGLLTNIGSGSPNRLLYSPHTFVRMQGLSDIDIEDYYTWTAYPYGGNGSYQYQWQIKLDGSQWDNILGATSPNYTRYVGVGHPDFDIRVQLMSYGDQVYGTEHVEVLICDPEDPEDPEECRW